jgi:hypothetical protein
MVRDFQYPSLVGNRTPNVGYTAAKAKAMVNAAKTTAQRATEQGQAAANAARLADNSSEVAVHRAMDAAANA